MSVMFSVYECLYKFLFLVYATLIFVVTHKYLQGCEDDPVSLKQICCLH